VVGRGAPRGAAAALAALLIAACTGTAAPSVAVPPEAAQVGTRITYYQAAASVAQSRYQIVEDPNCASGGPGCLTDPRTGKHYRRTDQGAGAQDPPTASGDGYSQMDIVAHDGRAALVDVNLYVIDRNFNQFLLTPAGRVRADAAAADGLWIHPGELGRLEREGIPGMLVARGPYQVGETTYDTLSFWSEGGGGRFSYTYDIATGLLVAANTSTQGAISPFRVENESPPQGNTQLTMTRLVSVRQRSLPGFGATRPDWLSSGRQLRYSGTYNWINPVDPSSGNLTYPVEHVVTIGEVGEGWAFHSARTIVQQLGQDSTVEGVTGAAGVYWYSAPALAGMTTGQQLDADPVTGERVTVAFVGQAANGGSVVVIESQLPGVSSRAVYDAANGMLTAYDLRMASSGITVSVTLQEVR
jgi:hypothetical protein